MEQEREDYRELDGLPPITARWVLEVVVAALLFVGLALMFVGR